MIRSAWRFVLALLLLSHPDATRAADAGDSAGLDLFESKIRPVLIRECYSCHAAGAKSIKGGLRLDLRAAVRAGGESGPILVPGKPEESPILEALRHEGLAMPPRGKLPDAVIADFERWIELGAPDPREGAAGPVLSDAIDIESGREFWAYRPPREGRPPEVRDAAWPSNEIDRFVLAGLEAKGLRPAPEADRNTLARRLAYDLTGLPLPPGEVDEFVMDETPDAYERLVDRLLASPAFGERWGRHWLDVARFAESLTLRGFIFPHAWRYRDYVVDAFNADLPFDRFIREQIAGDLSASGSILDRSRQITATTFLMLGNANLEEQDKRQLDMDVVDEQLDTIGKAILGQTIGCARCHDHKFDPIPTKDYYALAGILASTRAMEHANVSKWLEVPLPVSDREEAAFKRREAAIATVAARIKAAKSKPARDKQSKASLAAQESELKRLKAADPQRPMAMTVLEKPEPGDTKVHIRGSVHTLGDRVARGFIRVATLGTAPAIPSNQSGRRELADWLGSDRNPLTARVFANRAWHWLFGAGLVRTVDNLGTTGELPSHPELLDHLAVRFAEDGWSVKRLVRRIVLSRTYRLNSAANANPKAASVDPENRLLWRQNRRRLDAECIRDTILATGGSLHRDMHGPGFSAALQADYDHRDKDGQTRRSIYVPVFRNALPELFEVFDFADPSMVVGRRNVSTVAPQALFLMNHPFVLDQARRAACQLLNGPDRVQSDGERATQAYRWALGRPPTLSERELTVRFVAGASGASAEEVWTSVFQALYSSVDFRYIN